MHLNRFAVVARVALVHLLLGAARSEAEGGFSLSISASDLSANVNSTSPPVGGFRELFLWLTCSDPDLSALEFGVTGTFPTIFGFTPAPGVLNIGTNTDLFLAIAGCPSGGEDRILGKWGVYDPTGGSLCPGLSSGGVSAGVTCIEADMISPYILGFTSTGGAACTTGVATCVSLGGGPVSVGSATWGRIKSSYLTGR